MQKKYWIISLLLSLTLPYFAQTSKGNKSNSKQVKKTSYTVQKEPNTTPLKNGKNKFVVAFIGADGKPHKGGARLIINNDTIFPKLNDQGKYIGYLSEGKYKINAFVPYWHEINTDSITFKKDLFLTIKLKFEAIEIKGH